MALFKVGIFLLVSLASCAGAPSKDRSSAMKRKALFEGPQIYLSVSSEAGFMYVGDKFETTVLLDRMLEMHWLNFTPKSGDMIRLYSVNPMGMNETAAAPHLLEQHEVLSSSGKVKTSVRYERRTLNSTAERCLGFWVAYSERTGNETRATRSTCLMIHPTWMNDMKEEIKDIPLGSLMIPGTHNAGSWHYYRGAESEGPYIEYTFTQEDSVYEQLIHGIRALDVRVGYYRSTTEKFFVNHDVARIRPLSTLLEDVKRFVEETGEIVMLDFHRFPVGFKDDSVHDLLVNFVGEYLGHLLAPKSLSLSVTAGQLFELGKTVVLFYNDGATESKYDILWPGVVQAWADTNKLDQLEYYLDTSLTDEGCKGRPWSAMAHLTTTVQDALLRPSFGVRGYANISNDEVSQWFQRERWYSRAMIVALDFYRSTNVIETAIEVNRNNMNQCV